MNISAQVIDTIVEWIVAICINRCVLMILRAMPGIRNGICNGCFYSTKGKVSGATFRERKLLLRRATCEIPTSGFMISA